MRREIWTGCVASSSPWDIEPLDLDIGRSRVDDLQVSRVVVIALQQSFIVGTRSPVRSMRKPLAPKLSAYFTKSGFLKSM